METSLSKLVFPLDKFLMLYATCIPVKGSRRSIICDLQRERFDFIPNSLYELLINSKNKKLSEIIEEYGADNEETLMEYLHFLDKNDYIFFTNSPAAFPDLELDWRAPHSITNAIIDFNKKSNHDMVAIIEQLSQLDCPTVQFRFYDSPSYKYLCNTIALFDNTGFRTIELILPYFKQLSDKNLSDLIKRFPRLKFIKITSAPFTKSKSYNSYQPNVQFVKTKVDHPGCCGNILTSNFQVNIHLFTESLKNNSCLNRKISIDAEGFIKNCPTSSTSFGKFGEVELKSVTASGKFKQDWSINKDQVTVCKDCEFRYICTDCRVILTNPEDKFSKPLKCLYDPYTATWNKKKVLS